jgi:hypothetical protein
VLRVARDGGTVTAFDYPALTKALWKSGSRAPALREIVAFGVEDGYLAGMDRRGSAVRVDLRLGTVSRSRDSLLRAATSADGTAIYALTASGTVTRFTASGGDTWTLRPPKPLSALFAQADGSLIGAVAERDRVVLWRVRPPGKAIVDSVVVPAEGSAPENAGTLAATAGSVGDRVFFGASESVVAVRTLDMQVALNLPLGAPVRAVAATPSGDRLFVALAGDRSLRIVDRFAERVSGRIKLPGAPLALRMDPLGRVLLVRGGGDSVHVVSLANDEVIGTVTSPWRTDLPLVLADGTLALVREKDVVLADPTGSGEIRTIVDGAADFWLALRWNGFRPRAKGLDAPVEFRRSAPRDSGLPPDAGRDTARDTSETASGASSEIRASATLGGTLSDTPRIAVTAGSAPNRFTVSFAAVPTEREARTLALRLRRDGTGPRITSTERNGGTLYRVVMGPYVSRADAERIGRASGQSYWIFEGVP